MSAYFAEWDEQTLDLVVDRVTVGVDRSQRVELEQRVAEPDLVEFEQAVAAIHLGHLPIQAEPSSSFLERLELEGRRIVAAAEPEAEPALPDHRETASPSTGRLLAFSGWLAAAALLAAMLWPSSAETPAPDVRRDALAAVPDALTVAWGESADAAALEATGDVVWSTSLQEGYMRFRGLEPNDPTAAQYQLWIFDKTRKDWEDKPVDGGVFDVPESGEVVVPIDPKLPVGEPVLFAVTLEVPGGVVVSERERLVLAAPL